MRMSQQVRTRTADQCRSHHQKILKYHRSLRDIVNYYKRHLFGKQVKGPDVGMLKSTATGEE